METLQEEIKQMFLKALNTLVDAKEETIENLQGIIETVCQTDTFDAVLERLEQELRIIAENLANLIQENTSVALNQTEQAEKTRIERGIWQFCWMLFLVPKNYIVFFSNFYY